MYARLVDISQENYINKLHISWKIASDESFPFKKIHGSEKREMVALQIDRSGERLLIEKNDIYGEHGEKLLEREVCFVYMEKDATGNAMLGIPSGLFDEYFPISISEQVLVSVEPKNERLIIERYKRRN